MAKTITSDQVSRKRLRKAAGSGYAFSSQRVARQPAMEAAPASTPEKPEKVEYLVERSSSWRITRRFSSASRASGGGTSRSRVIWFLQERRCECFAYQSALTIYYRLRRKGLSIGITESTDARSV